MFLKIVLVYSILLGSLQSETALEKLKKAENHYLNRDYLKAIEDFKSSSDLNPGSYHGYLGAGKSYYQLDAFPEAEIYFQKAIETSPKNPELVYHWTLAKLQLKKPEECREYLDKLPSTMQNDPYILLSRAEVFRSLNQLEKAIPFYKRIQKESNLSEDGFRFYSDSLRQRKKYAEAKEILKEGLKNFPQSAELHALQALILMEEIRKENWDDAPDRAMEAKKWIDEGIEFDSKNKNLREIQIKVQIVLGDTSSAKTNLLELMKEYPKNNSYLYLYSHLLYLGRENISDQAMMYLDRMEYDDLARTKFEIFALDQLKEFTSFRQKLFQYRYNQFKIYKSESLKDRNTDSLIRTKQLSPNQASLKEDWLDYTLTKSTLLESIRLYQSFKEEEPNNPKWQNRLDASYQIWNDTLTQKRGYSQLKENSIQLNTSDSYPYLIVFPFRVEGEVFPWIPDSGIVFAKTLNEILKRERRIHLVPESIESELKLSFGKVGPMESYFLQFPFKPSYSNILKNKTIQDKRIKYAVYGSLESKNDSIKIQYEVLDLDSAIVTKKGSIYRSGRDFFRSALLQTAKEISSLFPVQGQIIEINPDSILVNLGKLDRITPKSKLMIVGTSGVIFPAEVKTMDDYLTEIKIPDPRAFQLLRIKDWVYERPEN